VVDNADHARHSLAGSDGLDVVKHQDTAAQLATAMARQNRRCPEHDLVILSSGTGARVPEAGSTLRRAADDGTRQVGTWRGFHVSATWAGHEPFTETTARSRLTWRWGAASACRPEHPSYDEHADKASWVHHRYSRQRVRHMSTSPR
jgi:hypothetical protein